MKLNHEGPIEKSEPCPDQNCDRKFRTCQEAQKHYKSFHLEIKEMCPICGGWFKALYQHTLAVHKNNKKHVCSDCGKAFSKKHDLMMHRYTFITIIRSMFVQTVEKLLAKSMT